MIIQDNRVMAEPRDVFSILAAPIRRAIADRGFPQPTDPQTEAIPLILQGKNTLLIAPTGTGKTEAAFLPMINSLIKAREERGIKALYITPLRALNRDLIERLEYWCKRLDVKLAVRHGDTDPKERSAQARAPPDILITTPETLQAILPGRLMGRHLGSVRWVVIDEVHELATDKRGSQLALGLERLRLITGREFQVVGLSATIGTPELVAKYLVGNDRPYEIVHVPVARSMQLNISCPKPTKEDFKLASELYTFPEVAARLRVMRALIQSHTATLLFTNTRSEAEVLASRFRVWNIDLPIGVHHGSLSRLSRVSVERELKEGKLLGIVCTSSLEMGIDVGVLDLVLQYNSPRQVTRLLQRVGRSGHRIFGTAKGTIITQDSDDALEALVVARRALVEDLEAVPVPEKPLDALSHQIAGLLIQRRRWSFDEVLEVFTRAYPYRDLSEEELRSVLEYMHNRYPRFSWVNFEERAFIRPQNVKELYNYYFGNLSMIPEVKQYLVVEEESGEPIGILDEAFVAEHGEIGTKFVERGSMWRLLQIYRDKIYVKAEDDPTGAIPTWVGEEIPVPFEVASEVGKIRRTVEEGLGAGSSLKDISSRLSKEYPCDAGTLLLALSEIAEQIRRGLPVPTDRRLTIEKQGDLMILHCCFGLAVNRTLARILGFTLSERLGSPVEVQQDPYRVVVKTDRVSLTVFEAILRELRPQNVRELATQAFTRSGMFKRRFLHVARKFGAVAKTADITEVGLNELMKGLEGAAIFEEALRTTLSSDADVPLMTELLEKIKTGEIEVVVIEEQKAITPIGMIGIEKIKRMTDLVPPQRMKRIILESAKARLMGEVRVAVCTSCWEYLEMVRIRDLQEIKCSLCGSRRVGLFDVPVEKVQRIIGKKPQDVKDVPERERNLLRRALRSADLISTHGLKAAVALVAKGVTISEASSLLKADTALDDGFIESILEAERKALKRRFFAP